MHIGGVQKNSLIDYPGKLCSVIFSSGCNFDCPYCHNPDLVRSTSTCQTTINSDEIVKFLAERRRFLDGVVISGGEPTLQHDLVDFCKKIKHLGFPVKLDTNGSRPQVLHYLIKESLIDYVAMDLKTDPVLYKSFIKPDYQSDPIFSSVDIIMQSGIDYEFRTTCVKPMVTPETIVNISRRIQGASRYALQRFRNRTVLYPEFFKDCNCEYTDDELGYLRDVAQEWVKKCIVR